MRRAGGCRLRFQTRGRLNLTNIWPRQARIYGRQGIFWQWAASGLRNNCEAMPKINQICDLIATLEMEPHDAELLRKMMCDFRTRHAVATATL